MKVLLLPPLKLLLLVLQPLQARLPPLLNHLLPVLQPLQPQLPNLLPVKLADLVVTVCSPKPHSSLHASGFWLASCNSTYILETRLSLSHWASPFALTNRSSLFSSQAQATRHLPQQQLELAWLPQLPANRATVHPLAQEFTQFSRIKSLLSSSWSRFANYWPLCFEVPCLVLLFQLSDDMVRVHGCRNIWYPISESHRCMVLMFGLYS